MTFNTPPADFKSKFDIVGCYVEYDGKFIILKRQSHKPQGILYGLPAGKVDAGETLDEAMIREIREETGIVVQVDDIIFLRSFPTRYPDYDFMFHAFKTVCKTKPDVSINPKEHTEFRWVDPKEAVTLSDGMEGLADYTKTIYAL